MLARGPSSEMIRIRVRVPRILAAATIRGWRLFRSKLPIVWPLFEDGDYSNMVALTVFLTAGCCHKINSLGQLRGFIPGFALNWINPTLISGSLR